MDQQTLNIELPQGSHLLGFKEDKRPSRLRFWLIVSISLVLGGAAVFYSAKALLDGIRMPQDTVAWALLRRGSSLPEAAPRIWREAAKDTRWPIIIGLAKDGKGWLPFVVTNRWNDGFEAAKSYSGILVKAGERDSEDQALDAQTAAQAAVALLTHPAYASLDLDRLDPALNFMLQGSLDGRIWRTNLPLKESATILPTDKEVSIDLDTWPDAWPAINDGLKGVLNGTEIAERPSFISWTVASDTARSIDLGYSQAPATSTIYNLAGALGLYDEMDMTLPDGSSLVELRWPMKRLEGKQLETDRPGITIIGLRNENLTFAKQSAIESRTECSSGKTVAYFSGQAIGKAMDNQAEQLFPDGIYFLEDGGLLKICY